MFDDNNLSVLSYANGFTLWNYKDFHLKYQDFKNCPGFFDEIYLNMNKGDKILINLEDAYVEVIVLNSSFTTQSVFIKIISSSVNNVSFFWKINIDKDIKRY